MQRPRHGGEGVLGLFDQDEHAQRTPHLIPQCISGDGPTRRIGADGRPWHEHCEPRDVGLTDPQTSRRAAARARKGTTSPLGRGILSELKASTLGATDDELQQVFHDAPAGSVSKRRCDLMRSGLVVDSGRTRQTRWGREAVVWTVTDG